MCVFPLLFEVTGAHGTIFSDLAQNFPQQVGLPRQSPSGPGFQSLPVLLHRLNEVAVMLHRYNRCRMGPELEHLPLRMEEEVKALRFVIADPTP